VFRAGWRIDRRALNPSEDPMKMKFVISLLLAAAFAVGCSKKNPQTTPTGTGTETGTETKKDGDAMGGDEYGAAGGTRPAGTPQEGSDADNAPK
jgi:hypothetical protein